MGPVLRERARPAGDPHVERRELDAEVAVEVGDDVGDDLVVGEVEHRQPVAAERDAQDLAAGRRRQWAHFCEPNEPR